MTPDSESHKKLAQARNLFIRRWGEMAASWGVSRTMAEIHALLYIADRPLCTDDFMEQLQISRGSTSMNLRQLENWQLISRTHRSGDRRDYFVAETDVWTMFQIICRERSRREIEPILETLERCRQMVHQDSAGLEASRSPNAAQKAPHFRERLDAMHEFLTLFNTLYSQALKLGSEGARQWIQFLNTPAPPHSPQQDDPERPLPESRRRR